MIRKWLWEEGVGGGKPTRLAWLLIVLCLPLGVWLAGVWVRPETSAERTGFLTLIAGVVGAAVLLFNASKTHQTVRNSQDSLKHAQRSSYDDRLFRAIGCLESDSYDVRAAAISSLGRLGAESDQHYQETVKIVLGYLRGQTARSHHESPVETRVDLQSAITVLGKRRVHPETGRRQTLDFTYLTVKGLNFQYGWFNGCNFSHSILPESDFGNSLLSGARFIDTRCVRCVFDNASLFETKFIKTELLRSHFFNPHPDLPIYVAVEVTAGRNIEDEMSDPDAVRLVGPQPGQGARMHRTDFREASLEKVDFRHTNLEDCQGITQKQLAEAITDETTKPPKSFARWDDPDFREVGTYVIPPREPGSR